MVGVRNPVRVLSVVAILLSLSLLPVALPVVAVTASVSVQQFIPNPNIGFYNCSASTPCPMGPTDYGINGKNTYTYTASAFESWANFTKLNIGNCNESKCNHQMTIQQNTVGYNVFEQGKKGGDNGEYWIQDVPYITQSGGSYKIQLLDNIWNFSSSTSQLGGTLFGNLLGDCKQGGGQPTFYYCLGKGSITTTLPFELEMLVTTSVLTSGIHSGSSYVTFEIQVFHSGALVGGATFDEVAFNGKATTNPAFKVGGMNPLGLYNDAEVVLCGPGGGSSVNVVQVKAKMYTFYLPVGSTTWTLIPHAWSAGTDTAETVSGVHLAAGSGMVGVAASGVPNNNQLW
jgi:hypothetical protein